MILNIHSDPSYLSSSQACSQVAGYYFLGSIPTDDVPIKLNGASLVFCGILKFVVASAAEAELGALFLNCKEGKIQCLILEELGHPQPQTPIHCDNATATGIVNDTVKKQRARAMEMRFFWVTDQVKQKNFNVRWQPGQENLADYFTKHFEPRHHLNIRPWYLHTSQSPTLLPRANAPSSLRGWLLCRRSLVPNAESHLADSSQGCFTVIPTLLHPSVLEQHLWLSPVAINY
eukprot:CCRYP_000270-RB/>CCRYP_000270-RB protein AED:0.55 eAED:0.55 QI:0/-1/0/1/-1/0/1/0/231